MPLATLRSFKRHATYFEPPCQKKNPTWAGGDTTFQQRDVDTVLGEQNLPFVRFDPQSSTYKAKSFTVTSQAPVQKFRFSRVWEAKQKHD